MSDSRVEIRNEQLPAETLAALLESMLRIRKFEDRTVELFKAGIVKGTAHSYAGQEAIAAGVSIHLRPDDYIGSYHRGHGHCIAKGARTDRMMAELMGRETGYCRGLGGSMHIADIDLNILGANGVIGATMPLGAGAALAAKLRGTKQVSVAYFGDSGINQGVFHESMNLAAVWKLPVIFVCENNQYALNTPFQQTTSVEQLSVRAMAYGVPGRTIDGNNVNEVCAVLGEAIERARAGEGPTLVEAITWRHGPHNARVNLGEPRSEADMAFWKSRDPILRAENELAGHAEFGKAGIQAIHDKVSAEIESAIEFGKAGKVPNVAMMLNSVYAPHQAHEEPTNRGTRELTYADALNEALAQEMERDKNVFLLGLDIAETGGVFQVTKGLAHRFGKDRVRDTPVSEATYCGTGVGAAIAGMRPVVEVQIFDFVTLMMDMIVNQAAKLRFMMGGKPTVPVVIRGPQGGGIRMAAQHSQSLEAWFVHVPGLVVVAPSDPYDAKGLLTAAIRDDNPVMFLEHKLLYLGQQMAVPEQPYAIPLGRAAVKRSGTDVTILATQAMVPRALSAANSLARQHNIHCEVIDPRTLRPLDEDTILESVRKTHRLVVAHEACVMGGFGAEITAIVQEKAFDWLDSPIVRIGAPEVPMPFNDELELSVIPSQGRIVDEVLKIMA